MVESIQRAIEYIENNLREQIDIEEVARHATMSPFHFQRVFTMLTEIPVGEYIRRRRLSIAAQELLTSDRKIIDIAFQFGYETPEAFTKAFRRQHGTSPTEVRKLQGKLQSYNRLVIQVTLKGADPMNYKVVSKKAFKVVGVKRIFSYENDAQTSEIPKLWEEVNQNGVTAKLFQRNDGPVTGVLGVCNVSSDDMKKKELIEYWVATAAEGDAPEGMDSMEIPASRWAIFEVRGSMPDAMKKAWKQIFSEWFPSTSHEHAGTPEFELYTDEDPSSPDLYSEIWIPIK